VSYYRPPIPQADSLQSLYSAVAAANSSSPVIINICGDFNVPDMDWVTASPRVTTPVTDTLCQFVSDPTRGDNVLDFTHFPSRSCLLCDSLPGCDHDAVHFSLAAKIPKQSAVKRTLYNSVQGN